MRVTYHGHSTVYVEVGGKRIIIDPFLNRNPTAVVKAEEIKADYIILTHGHGDHTEDAITIAKQNKATVIAVHELSEYMLWNGIDSHGMSIGGGYTFDFGHVRLTQAFHSSSIENEETQSFIYAGMPAGVLISGDGKTIYHAGDTGLFSDMKLIGELYTPDLAFLPIGDNYTMGPREALLAAEWTKVRTVIPIHYNTFPLIRQDGHQFTVECAKRGIRGIELTPGSSYTVE